MSLIVPNLAVFAFLVLVFGFIAARASKHIRCARDFFHDPSPTANVLSLTAANITLGSGLAYLLQGGAQNGLLMLLVPLSILLGYLLLASFLRRIPDSLATGRNFLAAVDHAVLQTSGVNSHFGRIVSLCLILVYVLYLAFEVFASAQIAVPILFGRAGAPAFAIFSYSILFIALIYALVGGVPAIFRTDKLQLALILVFVLSIPIANIETVKSRIMSASGWTQSLQVNPQTVIAVLTACLAAISTQFYSVVNWASISHVALESQSSVLKRCGALTALILALIVVFGAMYAGDVSTNVSAELMAAFSSNSHNTMVLYILGPIAVAGMSSILFSTVDSLIIAITHFCYDNVFRKDSRDESYETRSLSTIRRIACAAFTASFLFLGLFNFLRPNVFFLLLSIAGGTVVFAPALATAGYLCSDPRRIRSLTNRVVHGYLFIFLAAFAGNCVALFHMPEATIWTGTIAFSVSATYSLAIIYRTRRLAVLDS